MVRRVSCELLLVHLLGRPGAPILGENTPHPSGAGAGPVVFDLDAMMSGGDAVVVDFSWSDFSLAPEGPSSSSSPATPVTRRGQGERHLTRH